MLMGAESVLPSPKIGNFTAQVNGQVTDIQYVPPRSGYRIMLADVLKRVEQRLERLAMSATAASKKAGLSPDAIRNMRRAVRMKSKRQGVSTATITALAPVLETSVGWLMDGQGPEEDLVAEWHGPETPVTRVVGYVGAGAEAHFYAVAQGDLDEVPAPVGATADTRAVEIRGDSLGSMFDRWLVFYDDVRSPVTADLIGKLCIVGLPDDRVLIKKIRRNRAGLFDLLSEREPPIIATPVEWAAKVKIMTPR